MATETVNPDRAGRDKSQGLDGCMHRLYQAKALMVGAMAVSSGEGLARSMYGSASDTVLRLLDQAVVEIQEVAEALDAIDTEGAA